MCSLSDLFEKFASICFREFFTPFNLCQIFFSSKSRLSDQLFDAQSSCFGFTSLVSKLILYPLQLSSVAIYGKTYPNLATTKGYFLTKGYCLTILSPVLHLDSALDLMDKPPRSSPKI